MIEPLWRAQKALKEALSAKDQWERHNSITAAMREIDVSISNMRDLKARTDELLKRAVDYVQKMSDARLSMIDSEEELLADFRQELERYKDGN